LLTIQKFLLKSFPGSGRLSGKPYYSVREKTYCEESLKTWVFITKQCGAPQNTIYGTKQKRAAIALGLEINCKK